MDINNISPYIPTQYVDYSTPDINAVNLNKAEVALQRVTAAANEAINAIKELNAAKIDTAKIVTSLASTDTLSVLSGAIGPVIDQRLTDLLNKYNQLNGDLDSIRFKTVLIPESEYLESEKLKLGLSDFNISIGNSVNYIVKVSGRFDAILIGNISASNNYSSQLLVSSGDILNYRFKTSGTWKDWQSLSKA